MRFINLLILLFSSGALASAPETFTYSGRLTNANGATLTATVSVRFQILSPNDCLLYEERQNNLNVGSTDGYFSLSVGSAPLSPKRTSSDPGLDMKSVFSVSNTQVRAPASSCTSGYTPSAGDARKLRVFIEDGIGSDQLTPDQIINSVPFATTAASLQGKEPGDFIQKTQANMQTAIEALISGTSSMYLRTDGSNAADLMLNNRKISSLAEPTQAQDAATKNYCDTRIGGFSMTAAPTAGGQVLTWNSVLSQWQPMPMTDQSVQTHGRTAHPACSSTQASRWDGANWSCVSLSSSSGGGTGTNTAPQVNSGAAADLALTASSADIQILDFNDAFKITLPDATSLSLGGPRFSFLMSKFSPYPIPIFDSTGQYVDSFSLPTRLYLTDNSTAAGKWTSDSASYYRYGVEKAIRDSVSNTEYLNSLTVDPIDGVSYIVAYTRNTTAAPYSIIARIVSVDHVNKTATFGAETNIGSLGGSYSITRLVAIDGTRAVLIANGMATMLNLNLSNRTITPNTPIPFTGCNPNGSSYRVLTHNLSATQTNLVCVVSSTYSVSITPMMINGTSMFAATSSSLTPFASAHNILSFGKHDGFGILSVVNDSSGALKTIAMDLANGTQGNWIQLDGSGFNGISASGPEFQSSGYSSVLKVDATTFILGARGADTTKLYRLTRSGTTLSLVNVQSVNAGNSPSTSLGAAMFLEMGSKYFVRWSRMRAEIQNLTATPLQLSPFVESAAVELYHNTYVAGGKTYSINPERAIYFNNLWENSANKLEVLFKVGP